MVAPVKTLRHLWIAHESAWRAYRKQAKKRFTELQHPKPAKKPQPAASPATEHPQ